jgi:RND superfamily putative drug exporter
MFHRLGRLTASHPWAVCTVWLIFGLILALIAPHWDTRSQDDDVRFVPDRFTSVRAHHIMEQAFPQDVSACRLIFAVEREDGALTESDFALVDQLVKDLEELRRASPELKLTKVDSYKEGILGSRLTSVDQHCTLIQVSLETPFLAIGTMTAVDRADEVVQARVAAVGSGAPRVHATGAAGIGRDLTRACGDSLEGTTVATVILVIVVLMLVYRAPLMALVPLLTIATSVWVALNLLALMTLLPGVHLVNISKIFAIVILYGAGTDYCLFLISRYREELVAGQERTKAIGRSVGSVGEALAASAGTVMVGLGLMAFAEFAKVRYAGPAIALSLGIALLASLTLTPALLRLLGPALFWPKRPPVPTPMLARTRITANRDGFWDWVSHRVAARPALVWGVSVALLLPLAIIGARVEPNYRATGELSPSSESLLGLGAIQRHFTAGEIGPITVLLVSNTDWESREGRLEIDHLSRGFARLDNVAEVRSLTQPLGLQLLDLSPRPDGEGLIHALLVAIQPTVEAFRAEVASKAREHYVADIVAGTEEAPVKRYVTRMDVVLKSDPFEPESQATLELIQTWLKHERPATSLLRDKVQAECFGVTPNARDLADVTESDRKRVNWLVLSAIFLILLFLVRHVGIAVYLLVTVLLSYFAALGATVLAGMLWTGAPLPTVDWRVPFFLFTILVAVGEDYNIFLVSRALEERKRHGLAEGMRRALARTGGSITSCGLIMAGTFATLMLSGLNTLLQIGFALAFGVLIDTFLVRPFLVPAFILMIAKDKAPAQPAEVAPKREALVVEQRRAA